MIPLIVQMKEIFELEQIAESDVLRDYDLWDSLSVISLLAFIDSEWGVTLDAEDITEVNTVGDLWKFIETHIANRTQ